MRSTPPRLAEALLHSALRRGDRDLVLAELNEEYSQVIRPQQSWWAARAWYWRQAVGSTAAALTDRARARFHGRRPTFGFWIDVRDARRGRPAPVAVYRP
jgi:hypothetical protein